MVLHENGRFILLVGTGGIHVILFFSVIYIALCACECIFMWHCIVYPHSSTLLMCSNEAHVCLDFFFLVSCLFLHASLSRCTMYMYTVQHIHIFSSPLREGTHWIVSRKCDEENALKRPTAFYLFALGLSDKILICLFLLLVCVKCVHALFVYPASVKCVKRAERTMYDMQEQNKNKNKNGLNKTRRRNKLNCRIASIK